MQSFCYNIETKGHIYEKNTLFRTNICTIAEKGQTFQQIILSIVLCFLLLVFLVVRTDPMGNNGSVRRRASWPPKMRMRQWTAMFQSDESGQIRASADGLDQTSDGQNRQYRFKFRLAAASGETGTHPIADYVLI